MGKIRSLVGVVLLLSLGAPGCGGAADAQKKRVRELEEELTRLQNSHDRLEERLTSLELSRPAAQAESKTSSESKPKQAAEPDAAPGAEERALAATPATIERPPLKVFKLGPPGTAPAAEPSGAGAGAEGADEPRALIRGQGQRIEKALSKAKR
jgi:hypothetical protein